MPILCKDYLKNLVYTSSEPIETCNSNWIKLWNEFEQVFLLLIFVYISGAFKAARNLGWGF